MFRRTVLGALAASSLVASLLLAAPSDAATPVTVEFGLSAGTATPTGAACPVTVPEGANGLAVLDAAVAKRCIVSYKAETYSFGAFISCINEVCGAPPEALWLTYWEMAVDGVCSTYGVSDFRAAEGKQLTFSYTTWAKSFAGVC